MAKKDIINFSGHKTTGVNTSFIVGTGVSSHKGNGQADVMLVQTLLWVIFIFTNSDENRLLGLNERDLPEITGRCDPKTTLAIWKFQQWNAKKLMSVDGAIHPARYDDRMMKSIYLDYIFHTGTKPRPIMSITLLHIYAWNALLTAKGREDYISEIVYMAPDLRSWLN
jgi:hypothetical protein